MFSRWDISRDFAQVLVAVIVIGFVIVGVALGWFGPMYGEIPVRQ